MHKHLRRQRCLHTLSLARAKRVALPSIKATTFSPCCVSPLSYLQDNTRANAGVAAAPSVSYPCGRSRTLIRNAFGTSLSVLSCFCLLILFRTAAGLSLSRFGSFSAAAGAAWAWHCVGCSATRVCFFPRLRRATTVRLNFVRVLRIVLF